VGNSGRPVLRILGWVVAVIVVLIAVGITATVGWRPVIGPKVRPVTDKRFEATPARLERGRYLAENVMGCIECHTPAKEDVIPPVRTGPPGSGRVFVEQGKFRVVAPNITSDRASGLSAWTDDEIARAIREGVDKNGRTLFPIMPYQNSGASRTKTLPQSSYSFAPCPRCRVRCRRRSYRSHSRG